MSRLRRRRSQDPAPAARSGHRRLVPPRPGRATALLLASGMVAAVVAGVAVFRTVNAEQSQLLLNRATNVDTVVASLLAQVSTPFSTAAQAIAQSDGAAFPATAQAAKAGGISTLALLRPAVQGGGIAALQGSIRLTGLGLGGPPSPRLTAVLGKATPQYVGVAGTSASRTLGLALELPAPMQGWTLYGELTLPSQAQLTAAPEVEAFSDIWFALYTGPRPAADNLVLSTTDELPLRGPLVVDVPSQQDARAHVVSGFSSSAAGDGDLLLVVAARGSLAGPLSAVMPWAVAGVVLLATLLVATVVETAVRRRDQALVHARRLAETNATLEIALVAVEEAEESFRHLFDRHPNPMWVYDLDSLRFLAVNDAAVARYGYTRAEFLGLLLTDIRPAEDAVRFDETIRSRGAILDRAGPWRHRLKDGRTIWVEITSHEQEFAGRRAGLTLAQDVTDRVRLEEQLRHQAFHDPLTNLANRALFSDRMDQAIARSRRRGERWPCSSSTSTTSRASTTASATAPATPSSSRPLTGSPTCSGVRGHRRPARWRRVRHPPRRRRGRSGGHRGGPAAHRRALRALRDRGHPHPHLGQRRHRHGRRQLV